MFKRLSAANITLNTFRSSTISAHASRAQASTTQTVAAPLAPDGLVLAQVAAVEMAQLSSPRLDDPELGQPVAHGLLYHGIGALPVVGG